MPGELASARAKIIEENVQSSTPDVVGKNAAPFGDATGEDSAIKDAGDKAGTVVPSGRPTDAAPAPKPVDNSRPRERVSKRVRSKMRTSEKKTERKSKRSSVEYCLLAGSLSCTAQNPHYTELLKTDGSWEQLQLVKPFMQQWPLLSSAPSKDPGLDTAGQSGKHAQMVKADQGFISLNSLNLFIEKWSRNNSGPR